MSQIVLKILDAQFQQLKDRSFKSYDLCDITSQPYFLKMNEWCQGKAYGKYIKYPHNLLLEHFTPTLRKLYKIKKGDFAQSNAFIVRGLIRLFEKTQNEEYLDEASSLILKINKQKSIGFHHSCWGQPYDWFSGKIIPAHTPRTTVTSQIGKMFLEMYQVTKNNEYLAISKDIGDFFLEEMPLSYNEEEKTCYSYTTIDRHQVHNPNMMACGFLTDLKKLTGDQKYLNRAITAANFTFSHINADGSWYYAKLPNNKASKIDTYHTGYNIEGALILKKEMDRDFPYNDKLSLAIDYYSTHLFDANGIPFLTNKKRYPIDIQCCAQSIITDFLIAEFKENYFKKANDLFKWTVSHMYDNGSYYYRIFKNGSIDKTPYVRWGDAWMFFAGSLLLSK